MSYLTVKNMIAGILKGQALSESKEINDFEGAPATELKTGFILKCESGELIEVDSETLNDRFYDRQEWTIQIAFPYSNNNDRANLDQIHIKKDALLIELDDPANWRASVRFMKYNSWNVQAQENFILLTIKLTVSDVYIYT